MISRRRWLKPMRKIMVQWLRERGSMSMAWFFTKTWTKSSLNLISRGQALRRLSGDGTRHWMICGRDVSPITARLGKFNSGQKTKTNLCLKLSSLERKTVLVRWKKDHLTVVKLLSSLRMARWPSTSQSRETMMESNISLPVKAKRLSPYMIVVN